jgi:hemerythrin
VQAIDDQHGILLDALNELRMALLQGAECRSVAKLLTRVADLMRMHGSSEDKMLAQNGYPGLAAHRAEHQRLLAQLTQYEIRFEQRHSDSVYELVEYLRRWFTAHTRSASQTYGPWLQRGAVRLQVTTRVQ